MTTNEDTESVTSTTTNPTTAKSTTISSTSEQSKGATSSITARQLFGQWTVQVSEAINENLILVRYGTITSIALLSAYGLYKTPLFFRYKSVSDIPCMSFNKRQMLHGRIVHTKKKAEDWGRNLSQKKYDARSDDELEEPFIFYLYHLSPVQRLLNRSAFNFFTRQTFVTSSWRQIEARDDLIKVELAGVKHPSAYHAPSYLEQDGAWLRLLSKHQPYVTFQLLSRRVLDVSSLTMRSEIDNQSNYASSFGNQSRKTFEITNAVGVTSPTTIDNVDKEQTAICKIYYRPREKMTYKNFFRKDMAISLVQNGRAEVLSSGLHVEMANRRTIDGSEKLVDITSDVSYMDQLVKAEYVAIQEKRGLWANDDIREAKEKFINEVLAEAKPALWKRVLNWIKNRKNA